MRIHTKKRVAAICTIVVALPFILGGTFKPTAANKAESFVVANQESVYGQAISNTQYYKEKKEYDNRIQELEKQVNKLTKENQDLNYQLEKTRADATFSEKEWQTITKVMVHEAGYYSQEGEKNVCYVIYNRIASNKFPNNPIDVIYQPGQFEGATNVSSMKITDELIDVAKEAYYDFTKGEVSQGALFFARGKTKGKSYLFTDSIGHVFCK